jgi:hypothetical protein
MVSPGLACLALRAREATVLGLYPVRLYGGAGPALQTRRTKPGSQSKTMLALSPRASKSWWARAKRSIQQRASRSPSAPQGGVATAVSLHLTTVLPRQALRIKYPGREEYS